MEQAILGIDIAKSNFHAALLLNEHVSRKSFPNTTKGFTQLDAWLRNRHIDRVHACLEATGKYSDGLAMHLHGAGHLVSVVNAARIKGFARSELLRTKTDEVDAALIARFCKALAPALWTPPAPEMRELQSLIRRLASLDQARQQERNRADMPGEATLVARSIAEHIAYLDNRIEELRRQIDDHIDKHPHLREQRDLLASIPGIGDLTAVRLLGETLGFEHFSNAKQLAAFAGLSPQHRQSGAYIGKARLSKTGNAQIRKALYMPAVSAMKHNPVLRSFAQRLTDAGKHKMAIVGAVMRKLLHLAYGVLKSRQPFDPLRRRAGANA